MCALLTQD
jgi:hypothetical protein